MTWKNVKLGMGVYFTLRTVLTPKWGRGGVYSILGANKVL